MGGINELVCAECDGEKKPQHGKETRTETKSGGSSEIQGLPLVSCAPPPPGITPSSLAAATGQIVAADPKNRASSSYAAAHSCPGIPTAVVGVCARAH